MVFVAGVEIVSVDQDVGVDKDINRGHGLPPD